MAGFVENKIVDGDYEFHIDTPNVVERILHANNKGRVLTLQVDGDELDAVLWGLKNYKKDENQKEIYDVYQNVYIND